MCSPGAPANRLLGDNVLNEMLGINPPGRKTSPFFTTAALGVLMVFAIACFPASASASLCTDSWVGGSEGLWETALSWSAKHVPTSSDVACIGAGKTVLVSSLANQVGVLQGEGAVVVTGTIEVINVLEPSSIAALTVTSSGVMGGGAEVDVTSSFTGGGFGTLAGSGSTVIEPGATGTISTTEGEGFFLSERTLRNAGTFTVGVESGLGGQEHAKFINSGTLIVNGKGKENLHGLIAAEGEASLTSTGTVEKTEGAGPSPIEFAFANEGVVRSTAGILEFTGGGVSGSKTPGSWEASGKGTAIAFHGESASFALGAKVPMSGAVEVLSGTVIAGTIEGAAASITVAGAGLFGGGTLEVNGKAPSTVQNLSVTRTGEEKVGGILQGTGELDVTASFTGGGYATMAGTGSTVIEPGATGSIEPISSAGLTLEERTLSNAGTLTLGEESGIAASNHARLLNSGTLILNGDGAESNHGLIAAEGEATLVNTGIVKKTAGTKDTPVEYRFENFGQIHEETGPLKIYYPVSASAGTQEGLNNPSAPGQQHPDCGDPVNCATGNFSESQTDLAVGGRGVGLTLTRTYNSNAAATATGPGSFGYGWSGSFSDHLVFEKESQRITVVQANASTVAFAETEGGSSFTAPAWSQDAFTGNSKAGYTLTLENQTKYSFEGSSGRLTSVADRNGNTATLAYDGSGRLETITDPAGRKITLAYNGEKLVESAKDPMGHTVKYAYEGGDLLSVTEPGEKTPRWQFTVGGFHLITTMTDGRSGTTTNEYDESHRVISQTDPAKRTLTFEYAPFDTKITNHSTETVIDERLTSADLVYSLTRGYGSATPSTESFTYDAANNLSQATDGNGHSTTYTYDEHANRTSMLDADKHETRWTYNATHDVETIKTPKGETTTIARDEHGNAESVSRPISSKVTQSTHYTYDAHGEVTSLTDPLERVWKYEYNNQGDRTNETDPEGDKRTCAYDEDSQETSTVSPRGNTKGSVPSKFTAKIERDAQERPTTTSDALGHTEKYAYDGNGNLESLTDGNGHKTSYTYDADSEPTQVKAPNGALTETGYDGEGRVISQTDGNKNTVKYVRNALGAVTEVIDPLGRKTTKEYDLAGNLTSLTDAAKRTATYSYDPANRLKEVSYSDGKTPTAKYEYDADSDRTGMTDGSGKSSLTYDQLDRLTESTNGHGTTSYEYDTANEQTKIVYPSKNAVVQEFDKAGRLKSVKDWLEHTTRFEYNPDSTTETVTFPTTTKDSDKYAYNNAGQLTEVKLAKGSETLASIIYTRDSDGQVTTSTQKGLPSEEKQSYEYDLNNRLSKGGTIAYGYDAANNPTKIAANTYTYDKAGQLETGAGTKFAYDALGERSKATPSKGPATSYSYDQAGNLTAVTRPEESKVPAIKDAYAYDGNGLRSSQTIGSSTTYLTWNVSGQGLPTILNDGQNSYIYGPGGLPVEQIDTKGTTLYLHHDQAGSTRLITASTGATAGTTTYDPYGNPTGSTGTSTTPLGYDGQYTSNDTGLIYLRARTYDPTTAQFLSVDPLKAITGEPYAYATDDPLTWVDPSGLFSLTDITEGVAKAGKGLLHAGLDVAAVVPYAAYFVPYYAAKGVNEVGCSSLFGPVKPVTCLVSHIAVAPAVVPETGGLALDAAIDLLKGESPCDEGLHGYINPLHSFLPSSLRGPTLYLPGIHPSGVIDFEW